jgi:hypothetical protein
MGDEWPRPVTGVFHNTFLSGAHSSGRFFSSETPEPSGPRHAAWIAGPDRPELHVAAVFAGAFLFARILKKIAE